MRCCRVIIISFFTTCSLACGTFSSANCAEEDDPWHAHYDAGTVSYRKGEFHSASDSFAKALDIALSGQSTVYRIYQALTGVVSALRAQERNSEARQACEKVMAYYQGLADAAQANNQPIERASYVGKIQDIRIGIYKTIPDDDKTPTSANAAQLKFPNSPPSGDSSPYRLTLANPVKRAEAVATEASAAAKVQLKIPQGSDGSSVAIVTGVDSISDPSKVRASLNANNAASSGSGSVTDPSKSIKSGEGEAGPEEEGFASNTLPAPIRFPYSFEASISPPTSFVLPDLPGGTKLDAAAKEKAALWSAKVNAAVWAGKHENYALAASTSSEALKLAEQIGPNDERVAISLVLCGEILSRQGKYADAEPLLKRATDVTERLYGPNDNKTASALYAYGLLKFRTCDYSLSRTLLQRALSIREQQVGAESPLLFGLTNSLADAYLAQGKYGEAEVLFTRNLRVAEKSIGPKSHLAASAAANLSRLYGEQKKYKEALELAERALSIDDAALGSENRQIATHLNNIATLKMYMKDFEEAESYLQRALAIEPKQSQFGILHNLGALYLQEARFKESEETLQKALAMNPLPANHPQTLQIKTDLSSVYAKQGRFDNAIALLNEVVAQKEKTHGENSPDVAPLRSIIAELDLAKQGKLAEAERLAYQRATKEERAEVLKGIPEKSIDAAATPDATSDMVRSAALYHSRGNYAKAEELYRQAIAVYEKSNPNDVKLAPPLQGLGSSYMRRDRFSEAEPLFKRAVTIVERSTGPNSEATAKALEMLASMYLRAKRGTEALPLLKRATKIAEDKKSAKLQLKLLVCQAELARQEGRFAESEAFCSRALPIIATKREFAPEFNRVYYCLYQINFEQKRYEEAATYLKKTMASQEQLVGKTNKDYATMVGTYGQLLVKQEKYFEAESALKESIAIREAVTGDDPEVAVNLIELGGIYLKRGQLSESAIVCKRALSIYDKQLPPHDQRLGQLLANLGAVYARQGDYTAALPYCKRAMNIFTQNGFIRSPIGASFATFYAEVVGKASISH